MSPATSTPTTVNLVQKSQLARLLATENMTIEHSQSAKTASFDTNKRKLILPIWSKATEDCYDMLVAHEVGHALITPTESVYMPVCKRMSPADPTKFFPYLNIVEDIRVDNEIKDRYPGVRRSYFNAYKELMERDFFGINDVDDLSELSFGDRLNIHTKVGQYGFVDVPFTDEERAVVDAAMNAKSFDDVIAVAEKVWNMSRQSQTPEPQGGSKGKDASKDDQSGQSPQGDAGKGDQQEQDQTPQNGGDKQDQEQQQEKQSAQGNATQQNTPAQTPTTAAPDLKTVDALAKKFESLTDKTRYNGYTYYDMPRLNLDNIIFPYKQVMKDLTPMRGSPSFSGGQIFAEIQDRNKNFVANLVKQFEQKMAADECRRTRTAKTGQLDMRKIANYKFSDDLFIKNQITADGKNHGMVFIMDWSGSMGDYLLPTVEQLIALCMFCRKMNIPFEVYAFTNAQPKVCDPYGTEAATMGISKYQELMNTAGLCSPDYTLKETQNYYGATYKDIDTGDFLSIRSFGMIQFLSSKMNTKEFKDAAELFCQCARNSDHSGCDLSKNTSYCDMNRQYGLSSTPLNEAIVAGIEIVNRFKVANRLDIVNTVILTDGEPTSSVANPKYGDSTVILNLPNRRQMAVRSNNQQCPYGGSVSEMLGLAEVFREMTNSNLISIRLSSKREASHLADAWSNGNMKEADRMKQEWKDNDFFSYSTYGFTESFVIDSKTEVIDDDDILGDIKDNATIGVITRAFIKGNVKKATSRVLLSRFSDLIAKKVLA
jgi:hypothetical protein